MSEEQKQNPFKAHFEWARYQLKYWDDQKQVTIKELAERLEKAGMPPELIASEITRELEGYTTKRYIDMVLEDKYKDKTKAVKKVIVIDSRGNISPNEDKNEIEETTIKEPIPAMTSHDEAIKQTWRERTENTNEQPTYKHDDDLITKTEHNRIVKELTDSINKLVQAKNKDYENSQLYKDQQLQIEFQRERITELEEIESKTVREHGFTSASNMTISPNRTTKVDYELGFNASMFAKFFMDCRNCKAMMYLRHDGKNIVGWRNATPNT